MRILIVEDEKKLAQSIFDYLKKEESLECDMAFTYQEAFRKILDFEYDCIILDITLPDGSGFQILAHLKEDKQNTGVLIVSARNSLENRIEGLDLGADDYITKPFHLTELNARLKSILRRRNFNGNTVIHFDSITIRVNEHLVFVNDQLLNLTPKEYSLLMYFVSNKDRVVSKESLIDHFWDSDYDQSASNDLIYAHIKNLRHKIMEKGGKDYIRTVYGIGYKLTDQ